MTRSRPTLPGAWLFVLTMAAGLSAGSIAFGDEAAPSKPGADPAARLRVPDGYIIEVGQMIRPEAYIVEA